jgi:PKD repeat protein
MKNIFYKLLALLTWIVFSTSCEDKNTEDLDFFFSGNIVTVKVGTGNYSNLTSSSALIIDNTLIAENISISEVGLCWSKDNPNPSFSDSHVIGIINSQNKFDIYLSGLLPDTKYYVRAYAKDAALRLHYADLSITFRTLFPEIKADFSYYSNGLTIWFTNLSTNATSYNWNFGDGNISNETNPTHTYSASGVYTVELTAYGSGGSDNKILNIQVPSP